MTVHSTAQLMLDLADARRERDEAISGRCALNTQLDKAVAAVKRTERERDEAQRKLVENAAKAVQDGVALVRQLTAANRALVEIIEKLRKPLAMPANIVFSDATIGAVSMAFAARAAEGERR